jgi:hypothetical protein
MNEPELAGDDALNSLVDFYDTFAGTRIQGHADRKAKKHRGNKTKHERPTNDAGNLVEKKSSAAWLRV